MAIHIWSPGDYAYDVGNNGKLYPIESDDVLEDIIYDKRIQQTSYIQSNIVDIFQKWICSFFEPNYFKFVRISTQSSMGEFKSFMRNIYKKEKPFMVINPQTIEHVEDSLFGQNMISRYNMIDPEHDNIGAKLVYSIDIMNSDLFRLVYRRNRYRFEFDTMIMEQTLDRQINTYDMLMMTMRHNSKFLLPRTMDQLLPIRHIVNIAKFHGYDPWSPEYLEFLNSISKFPIIRRILPNGKYMFFMQQTINIQVEIPGYPSKDSPETSDAIEWGARIAESFQFVVDLPTEFLFLTTKEYKTKFDTSIDEDPADISYVSEIFRDMDWAKEENGFILTNRVDISMENGEEPKVYILPAIEDYDKVIYETIKEFINRGGTINDIVQVRVYPNGSTVPTGSILHPDGTLELTQSIPNKIYTVNIYVNLRTLNTIQIGKNTEYAGTVEKY